MSPQSRPAWRQSGGSAVLADRSPVVGPAQRHESVDPFAATREWEWRQWQDAVTDWELRRYFEII